MASSKTQFDKFDLIPLKRMVDHSNPGRVKEVADHWKSVHDELQSAASALQQAVEHATSNWEGAAADGFSQRAGEIHTQMVNTAGHAVNTSAAMTYAGESLDQTKTAMSKVKVPDWWDSGTKWVGDLGSRSDAQFHADLASGMDRLEAVRKNYDELSATEIAHQNAIGIMEYLGPKYSEAAQRMDPPAGGNDDRLRGFPPPPQQQPIGQPQPIIQPYQPPDPGDPGQPGQPTPIGRPVPGPGDPGYKVPGPGHPTNPIGTHPTGPGGGTVITGGGGNTGTPVGRPTSPDFPVASGGGGGGGGGGASTVPTGGGGGYGGGMPIGGGGLGGVGGGRGGGSTSTSGRPGSGSGSGSTSGSGSGSGSSANGGKGTGTTGAPPGAMGMGGMGGMHAGGMGGGGGKGGGKGGSGLVRRGGGTVGGARSGGASGRAFTEGGSGLGRSRGQNGAGGMGGAGMGGAAGNKKKGKNGNRPDYLVEDEDTWRTGGEANPPVIE